MTNQQPRTNTHAAASSALTGLSFLGKLFVLFHLRPVVAQAHPHRHPLLRERILRILKDPETLFQLRRFPGLLHVGLPQFYRQLAYAPTQLELEIIPSVRLGISVFPFCRCLCSGILRLLGRDQLK